MLRKIYCRHLNRTITISPNAIENKKYGWICDCGKWTKEDTEGHVIK